MPDEVTNAEEGGAAAPAALTELERDVLQAGTSGLFSGLALVMLGVVAGFGFVPFGTFYFVMEAGFYALGVGVYYALKRSRNLRLRMPQMIECRLTLLLLALVGFLPQADGLLGAAPLLVGLACGIGGLIDGYNVGRIVRGGAGPQGRDSVAVGR